MQVKKATLVGLMACVGLAMPAVSQVAKPTQGKQPTPAVAPKTTQAPATQQPHSHPHGAAGQPSDAAASPLAWSEMSYDFGNIPDTDMVSHVFKFHNKSDKRVTIQSATGSCGCTVPDLKKKVFEPGESGEMTVTFNPQHRQGPQPKNITVTYSEPAGTPQTLLSITSNVQPLMVIEPPKMYLMEVDAKTGKSTEINVSGRKSDFKVEKIVSTNENLLVTVGDKREVMINGQEFQQYPISVSIKPNTPIGEFQTQLEIHTNEPTKPVENYMFVADVVGELRATPQKLQLRAYTPNIPFANIVNLESRSGKAFKVLSVDVVGRDDMQLVTDFEANPATGKPAYTIRLSGVTPDMTGVVQGDIIVRTDMPDNPEIRLPFSTTIRGSTPARPVSATPQLKPGTSPLSATATGGQ